MEEELSRMWITADTADDDGDTSLLKIKPMAENHMRASPSQPTPATAKNSAATRNATSKPIEVPRLTFGSPKPDLLHQRRATEPHVSLNRHNTSPNLVDMASENSWRTRHRESPSDAGRVTSPNRHDLTRSGSWKWEDMVISMNGMQRSVHSSKSSPASGTSLGGLLDLTTSSSSSPMSASSSSSLQSTSDTAGFTSVSDIRLSDLSEIRILGAGAMGLVKKVRHIPTDRAFAMKVLTLNSSNKPKNILAEVKTLSESKSRYILGFVDAFCMESKIYILIEYMNQGSLKNLMDTYHRQKAQGKISEPMSENLLACISRQVLLGLADLHDEYRTVHRDLKPDNILINSRGEIKISDFGMAGRIDDDNFKDSFQGTITYMSPERLLGEDHSFSSDIWSLGVVLAQCALGRFPFSKGPGVQQNTENMGFLDLLLEIQNTSRIDLPKDYGPEFRSFVWSCMEHQPSNRPTAKQLLQHPFLILHPEQDFDLRSWLKTFYGTEMKTRRRTSSTSSFDSPRSVNCSPRLGPEMNLPQQETVVPELQIPQLIHLHRAQHQRRASDAMSLSPPQ